MKDLDCLLGESALMKDGRIVDPEVVEIPSNVVGLHGFVDLQCFVYPLYGVEELALNQ